MSPSVSAVAMFMAAARVSFSNGERVWAAFQLPRPDDDSRQQSRLDPSPFIVRTVIGFRHSIAGQPPKQAASYSVRSVIVVFPEIASFILIVHENAARLLLRPQQLRQLGDVGGYRSPRK